MRFHRPVVWLGAIAMANHDHVLLNGRPDGRRLKIAEAEFSGGRATGRNQITRGVSEGVRQLARSSLTLRVTMGRPISSGRLRSVPAPGGRFRPSGESRMSGTAITLIFHLIFHRLDGTGKEMK